jgi:hypothetical protein
MSKFAIIMKQVGEGCDYTIDCGISVELLEADNRADAVVEAERVLRKWNDEGNEELDSHELVEFVEAGA